MGSLQSKLFKGDRSLKSTPRKAAAAAGDSLEIDPRSPNIFRTPLSNAPTSKRTDDMCPRNILKSKFQSEYESSNNIMNDPRSPSTFIVRTPICLKTSNSNARISEIIECTVDDSVPVIEKTDVVEPTVDEHNQKQVDTEANSEDEENIGNVSIETVITTIDPRSPSLNIDRTPFFFANKTGASIVKAPSAVAAAPVDSLDDGTETETAAAELNIQTISKMIKTFIFEDNENNYCTPPKKICEKSMLADAQQQQRTPLSCLANRKNAVLTRTAPSSGLMKSFDGFAKSGNVLSSTRMELLNENTALTKSGTPGGDFSKEKVF